MMPVDPIQMGGLTPVAPQADAARPAATADFGGLISAGIERVDGSLKAADAGLQAYAAGADVPVHDVMIGMEKARLNLELAVEVRNRLVEAYQEFMRMQI